MLHPPTPAPDSAHFDQTELFSETQAYGASAEQRSLAVDRTHWTHQQWMDDAAELLGDSDTTIRCYQLRHVVELLSEVNHLRSELIRRDQKIERLVAHIGAPSAHPVPGYDFPGLRRHQP